MNGVQGKLCLGGYQASCGPTSAVLLGESASHPFGTLIASLCPTHIISVAGLSEAIVSLPGGASLETLLCMWNPVSLCWTSSGPGESRTAHFLPKPLET